MLRSDWITQGPAVYGFERAVAQYCGVRFAVAVSSATAGLHIACLAAATGPGKTVWTSPNTFVASANCALHCGAAVDFVDIDGTLNVSVEALELKLAATPAPDVIIPVHFSGRSANVRRIREITNDHGVFVIEDASHAIGGSFSGSKIGSCEFSDMCVFSFHPVKIITTGEGGVVTTNNEAFYEHLLRLRTHGITRNTAQMANPLEGPWYYEQVELGFNYRMTDIQAALGTSQLRRVDQFVERRRHLARRYHAALAHLPLTLPRMSTDSDSAWHLYVVRLPLSSVGKTRMDVFAHMRARGIGVNVHYIPVHLQPYYRSLGFERGDFPSSEQYYAEAMSLPLYYDLSEEDQDMVIGALEEAVV